MRSNKCFDIKHLIIPPLPYCFPISWPYVLTRKPQVYVNQGTKVTIVLPSPAPTSVCRHYNQQDRDYWIADLIRPVFPNCWLNIIRCDQGINKIGRQWKMRSYRVPGMMIMANTYLGQNKTKFTFAIGKKNLNLVSSLKGIW